MNPNPITRAIEVVGLGALAAGLQVSGQAIRKWEAAGHLPRTEWTGETDYSSSIQRLTDGAVKKDDLLSCRPPRRKPQPSTSEAEA